ncbi:hypothetical protein BDZ85DRAFT_256159 [Elsinoe ampelina]|uniref:Uncharacterized protein n=1 Tax=Elsinoe ampelina TaxID=302913 RepID=A0A6A6GKY4_9PEZI|nr:hypothetical protein BDZ85DRAFT_256159 [Elsinoe ampelina]
MSLQRPTIGRRYRRPYSSACTPDRTELLPPFASLIVATTITCGALPAMADPAGDVPE